MVILAVLVAACGKDGAGQASVDRDATAPVDGHAALRFSGAVTGSFDADLEVACFPPVEEGDSFTVSIDSDAGVPAAAAVFLSMDFVIPDYRNEKTYTLEGPSAEDEADFDDFFLLFEEHARDPFGWHEGTEGTVGVEEDGTAGRLSFRRWRSGSGAEVDVEGTFRCGRKP